MTDLFFICSIKSPQCADRNSKKISRAPDFPSPCVDIPKPWNFTSGGIQNQATGSDCDVISGLDVSGKKDFSDIFLLPKQVDREFKDKSNSWLWRQTLTILVTWLCLSNRKAERKWSHSFLLGDFAGTACCSLVVQLVGVSESTILVEAPNSSTESFLYHSAMMEPKMLPQKLSCMDFPRIRVRLLLFTEYAIVKSRTGMWPHASTFFVWQTKPRDQNRRRLPLKSTVTLVFEFAVYLFR